jgi:hypothetical protein
LPAKVHNKAKDNNKGGNMNVEVNWLAIVLATLSTMVVGSLWYTPKTFGNLWIKLAKIDTKKQKGMAAPLVGALIASFITAYILAHVTYLSHSFFDNSFLQDALSTGFWLWLGFVAARLFVHDAFEGRPKRLTLLNIAHEFVTIMIMALIIGLMHP